MSAHRTHFALLLAAVLLSTGASANTVRCGGDAFSSAEVVDSRRGPPVGAHRRGPVTAAPDTLCADVSDDRPATTPNIDVVVGGSQGQSGSAEASQGTAPSMGAQRRGLRR